MKAGILTFHNAINYGAILQSFALQETIRTLGHEVEVVDYDNGFFKEIYYDRLFLFGNKGIKSKIKFLLRYITNHKTVILERSKYNKLLKFVDENIDLSEKFNKDTIAKANNQYDCFVVGSDQVWNLRLSNYDTTYMLDFTNDSSKKKSYAASFGSDNIDKTNFETGKMLLNSFDTLLIREKSGKEILKKMGFESSVVLDPTFLYGKESWEAIAAKSNLNKQNDYIFVYCIATPDVLLEEIKNKAEQENLDVIVLGEEKIFSKQQSVIDASIEDFLWYIQNAKYVYTTSFHGMALSINMNKDFYYELSNNNLNNNSRLINLSELLGLQSREVKANTNLIEDIHWESVNERLEELKKESIRLLDDMLK